MRLYAVIINKNTAWKEPGRDSFNLFRRRRSFIMWGQKIFCPWYHIILEMIRLKPAHKNGTAYNKENP